MEAVEQKMRYSENELKEFEEIILKKLEATRSELIFIKETLSRKNDNGTDYTAGSSKVMEDGADTSEKEGLSQGAARLQKFAQQLDAALVRIKNGTYGVCKDSGKLIPKERLRAVPHTQQTIEAKLKAGR
jgi:DnaK suppressor protein